jgi:cyanate lyase
MPRQVIFSRGSQRVFGLLLLGISVSVSGFFISRLLSVWIYQFSSVLGRVASLCIQTLLYGDVVSDWLVAGAFVGGHLKEAVAEIEADREFTEAEYEAFQEFRDDVQSLSPQVQRASEGTTGAVALTSGRSDTQDGLEPVRERYRETVMSVPGYEEMYGEPLDEHIHAEFGAELASVVLETGDLTKPVQSLLVTQATGAVHERKKYLETLNLEYEAVMDANSQLQPTKAVLTEVDPSRLYRYPFEELFEYENDVRDAIETCEELIETRQHEIHNSSTQFQFRSGNEVLFQEFLYRPLKMSFPVLSTALEQVQELTTRRQAVIDSLARRV